MPMRPGRRVSEEAARAEEAEYERQVTRLAEENAEAQADSCELTARGIYVGTIQARVSRRLALEKEV